MYIVCIFFKRDAMQNVSSAVVLDKRIQRKDGSYAVKLRLTFNRKQRYYPINISLTPEDWEKVQAPNPRKNAKELKLYLNSIEEKAIKIIRSMELFSFEEFEMLYNKKPKTSNDTLGLFQEYIDELMEQKRIGSAESYKCALSSIKAFLSNKKKRVLHFTDITPEWLQQYENWMLENKKSLTTVGIYLRSLRTIYNIAISKGAVAREYYPFGKRKFQISASRNIKKALSIEEIKKIFDYSPTKKSEEFAKDIWIFSYLCNGANMTDIAKLRFSDITDSRIIFIRTKTQRTSRATQKPIVASMIPELKNIIEKYSHHSLLIGNEYVFGIISSHDDEIVQRKKIKQFTKNINKGMKQIAEVLEIDSNLTTYTARHSFATVLKRSGAPLAFISESLGHKDLKTTESYLDSFEDETRIEFQKKLLDFTK